MESQQYTEQMNETIKWILKNPLTKKYVINFVTCRTVWQYMRAWTANTYGATAVLIAHFKMTPGRSFCPGGVKIGWK